MQNERDAYKDIINEAVEGAKSEAIKEFAQRVWRMITMSDRQKEYFDDLVKEMT